MLSGIHIIDHWTGNVPSDVYTSDAVCVTICRYWSDLNTANGVYNWTALDADIANIMANGKTFGIKIAAGDNTPQWVYDDFSVPKLTFSEFVGSDNVLTTIYQPVFWHTNYIAKWSAFITALSAHLQSDAGVWAALSHVNKTGINRKTEEYRICAQASVFRSPNTSSDAPAIWLGAGYTENHVADTQVVFNTLFATQFPDKDLVFAMINYSGIRPFPLIDSLARNLNIDNLQALTTYTGSVYGMYTAVTSTFTSSTVTNQTVALGLYPCGQLAESQFGDGTAPYIELNAAMQGAKLAGYTFMEVHADSIVSYNQYVNQYNLLFSPSNPPDMSLINKFNAIEQTNLLAAQVYDTTNNYNATTNPGGYGAPNPTLVSVVADSIDVTVPNGTDYTPTGLTYTLDMFPTLPTINPAVYFTILPSDLGLSDDDTPMLDGLYQIIRTTSYGVTEPPLFVTYTKLFMFTGNVRCQLAQFYARTANGGCACCSKVAPIAKDIEQDLIGIDNAMTCELYNKAAYILTEIYRKLPKLNC